MVYNSTQLLIYRDINVAEDLIDDAFGLTISYGDVMDKIQQAKVIPSEQLINKLMLKIRHELKKY